MLQRFSLLPVVLLIFSALGVPSVASENRVLRVGIYENAPKVFVSESGRPAGIFVDIIEHIAKGEDWRLRYVPGTWTEGLDRLAKGDIDLMPDVAYTADRAAIYSFHKESVLSSWFQVYARKGSGIRSILDLSGKRIAVLDRSVQQEAFVRLTAGFGIAPTLISLPDYKTIFEIVAAGQADAAITNRFHGVAHAPKHGLEDTAVVFHPSPLFFAAYKSIPEQVLDTLDTYLIDMKSDPGSVYYGSLKRWISGEVHLKLPVWVETLGLILAVVLIMSIAGSVLLKRQVNARTRQLRQINREMEQRITQRTAELAEAVEKARAADRSKSVFLATMSHELRTPLNSIIGFTGIMLQGLAGPLNPEQHKQMSMVQGSARHLMALINDVLDISKIEAGQLTLAITPFDLKASIEKVVKMVSRAAEEKGLDLKLDIAKDLGTANTDQRRVEQVILNLINNAVKFTEKGRVAVSCRMEDGQYRLAVSDTGIGMKPEHLQEIFKPFRQIDTGLTRKYEGTGLGLSICKKIMEMMGGTIEVESRWGLGSTFTIRFPVHSGALQ
ncbi:MAG: transporter substrate-binding domain-containing protein [Deltaproteobacteria bacterium]|nr:transporter substrate-binding domain-containing protein [Deltaproteobacteria bacterium]